MKKILLASAVSAFLSIIAGCGGGGGGDSSSSNLPTGATVEITEANKTQVAAANVDALNSSTSSPTTALSFLPTGVEANVLNDSSTDTIDPFWLVRSITHPNIISALNNTSNVPVGVTQTEQCPGGGSATLDTNANLNASSYTSMFSSGVYYTITGNNCSINQSGYSMFINGSVTLRVNSSTSSSMDVTASMSNATIRLNGVSLYGDGETNSQVNGSLPYNIAESVSRNTGTTITSYNGVTRTRNANNLVETYRNGAYSLTGAYSNQGYKTRYSVSGIAEFSKNNVASMGAGTITTLTPFETANGATYPRTGQATIKGKKGTLRITALSDATNVSIELDANDDGIYESTQTLTWTALLASI